MRGVLFFFSFFLVGTLFAQNQNLQVVPTGSASNMVYAEQTQRLIAAFSSTAVPYPNSIVLIDPVTAEVDTAFFVGSNPSKMALSDDERTLYIELKETGSIARVNLEERVVEYTFSLGSDGVRKSPYRTRHGYSTGQP